MDKHIKRAIAVESGNPMEHVKNWGTLCGITGGLGNFLLKIQIHTPFMEKLIQSAVIAFVCAIIGSAAKKLFDILLLFLKSKLFKKKQ